MNRLLCIVPVPSMIDSRIRNIASALLLFLVVFLVYSQTITFDWVGYDDDAYVLNNPLLSLPPMKALASVFAGAYFGSYTPLTLLSHATDLALWGPSPAGHHLVNVLLHGLNAVWVFLSALVLLRGMAGKSGSLLDATTEELAPALLAAFLFALHPLRAESVSWIADRKDLLATAFVLPACILYLQSRFQGKSSRLSTSVALLLYALGGLAKTAVLAMSGVLVLLELAVLGRGKGGKERLQGVLRTLPFLLVSLAIGALALRAVPPSALGYGVEQLPPQMRWLLPGYSFLLPLWKTLCPYPLVPIYMAPSISVIIGGVICSLILAGLLVLAYARGYRAAPIAFTAYAILLVPVVLGLRAGIEPWADRYSYLATVPLFIAGARSVTTLADTATIINRRWRKRTVGVLAGCLLGMLTIMTVLQCRIWYNGLALWSHQLAHGDRCSVALNNMGTAYLDAAEFTKAREMFTEAVQRDPHSLPAMLNLRIIANTPGDYARLTALYQGGLRATPREPRLHLALGEMYSVQAMEDSAIVEYRRALEINPDYGAAFNDIGLWHLQHGRSDSAKACFHTAVQKMPGFAAPYSSLGTLALAEGDTAEAVRQLRTAARLGDLSAKQRLRSLHTLW